jgi:hypothetical protein
MIADNCSRSLAQPRISAAASAWRPDRIPIWGSGRRRRTRSLRDRLSSRRGDLHNELRLGLAASYCSYFCKVRKYKVAELPRGETLL